jgi:hypothetical protein
MKGEEVTTGTRLGMKGEEVTTGTRLVNIGLLSAGWCLTASALFIQVECRCPPATLLESAGRPLTQVPMPQVSIVTLAAADAAGKSAATVPIALFNVAAACSVGAWICFSSPRTHCQLTSLPELAQHQLAPDPCHPAPHAAAAPPAVPGTYMMLWKGRRPVFLCASLLGLLGGLLQLLSLWHGGYGLIVFGAVIQVRARSPSPWAARPGQPAACSRRNGNALAPRSRSLRPPRLPSAQGFAFSTANNYRFAAAEFSTPAWRPRAIAMVVFGGVLAAGIGPEISRRLRCARARLARAAGAWARALLAAAAAAALPLLLCRCCFGQRQQLAAS